MQRLGFLGRLQPLRLPPVLAGPQDVGRVPLPPLGALLLPHVVLGVFAMRGLLEALLQGEGIVILASAQACLLSRWGFPSWTSIPPMEILPHPWEQSQKGWTEL